MDTSRIRGLAWFAGLRLPALLYAESAGLPSFDDGLSPEHKFADAHTGRKFFGQNQVFDSARGNAQTSRK